MTCAKKTLRSMIDQWLPAEFVAQIHITRYRSRHPERECYVRVEAINRTGPVELYFFRHRDGSWRIYPPTQGRPAMHAGCFPEAHILASGTVSEY
jgi:hypothetical protein